jgi:hypothetical protein
MNPLEQKIANYQRWGWRLVANNGTSARMHKPKRKLDLIILVLLFIIGILPGLLYLFANAIARDRTVSLVLNANGSVTETGDTMAKWRMTLILLVFSMLILILICVFLLLLQQGFHPLSASVGGCGWALGKPAFSFPPRGILTA